jgi:hypothetical protein
MRVVRDGEMFGWQKATLREADKSIHGVLSDRLRGWGLSLMSFL